MRKLNILFRISGGKAPGKELGYGHVFRSKNLAYFFREHNVWFLLEDYGGVKNILTKNGFKKIINLKCNCSINEDVNITINTIKKKKIDIFINDVYKVNNEYLKKIRRFTKTVLITDLKKYKYSADLIVNGFIGFENQIIKDKKRKTLLGPKYQILDHRFSVITKIKPKNDLLVTFGGFDENNITEIFLEELIKFNGKIKTKIIHGPSSVKTKRIKEIEKKLANNISIVSYADMFKEISQTRFGLCSGGITTYEFATLGVPFAIISQVKHQNLTAKIWAKKKNCTNLGIVDKNTGKKISEYLENIMLNDNKISSKLIRTNGGKYVHNEIIKLVND
jgi:spore coat polysaccharide biosynthesis predicted glycosyltransferase SpsG